MTQVSTIGSGTTVRGNIQSESDLDIHGRVEGSVTASGDLLIGETALIKSDISGRRVTVRGAVSGNVFADESIVLEEGARVVGDLGAPSIGIRPGALVRGNVSTEGAAGLASMRARGSAAAQRPATRMAPVARPVAAAPVRAATPPAPAPKLVAKAAPAPAPVAAPAPEPAPAKAPAAAKSSRAAAGPPAPVVPSLKKGAKGSMKRKGST